MASLKWIRRSRLVFNKPGFGLLPLASFRFDLPEAD